MVANLLKTVHSQISRLLFLLLHSTSTCRLSLLLGCIWRERGTIFLLFLKSFGRTAQHVGSWFPEQGLSPCPLQWQFGVLTAGPPGKSQECGAFEVKMFGGTESIGERWGGNVTQHRQTTPPRGTQTLLEGGDSQKINKPTPRFQRVTLEMTLQGDDDVAAET